MRCGSARWEKIARTVAAQTPPPMRAGRPSSVDFAQVKNPRRFAEGLAHHMQGRYAEAGAIYYELDETDGPHYEARYFAAILAREALDPVTGIDLLHDVIAHRPLWTEAHYNLGVLYEEAGDSATAEYFFMKALEIDPTFASAWINKGNMELGRGAVNSAIVSFAEALRLVPDQPEAKVNAAHALLMQGDWLKGWAYYEERWRTPAFRARNGLTGTTAPMWDGSRLDGKTLVVFNEQGFGDTIIMLRFGPMLHALGARVVYRVPSRLVTMVRANIPDTDDVIDEADPLPPHDAMVPFMSLPYHLTITPETVPGAAGYLYPHLGRGGRDRLTVGLCWAGSPAHKNDRNRSMGPSHIGELMRALPNIAWESFQVGPRENEALALGLDVARYPDFDATARALASVDLLITVDTATAHLAGAMGVPTFLCIPAVPDMRWPLQGTRTAWYDSMILYRQPVLGDWFSVIRQLIKHLTPAHAHL